MILFNLFSDTIAFELLGYRTTDVFRTPSRTANRLVDSGNSSFPKSSRQVLWIKFGLRHALFLTSTCKPGQ